MKKFYFISGLPRSGNTLLASLLNQNPNILATGQSVVPSVYYDLQTITQNNLVNKIYPQNKRFDTFYNNLLSNFFIDDKEKYIIQRGEWITPINLDIIKKYCPNQIKIVIMVRNVLDIIKSNLNHANNNPDYFINRGAVTDQDKIYNLMEKDGYINLMLSSIKKLKEDNELKNYLIVDYDNFIKYPQKTLKDIYDYYGIKNFKTSLNNINQLENYKDHLFGHSLHKIYTKNIKKNNYKITLDEEIIEKYKDIEFWK